MDFPSNFCETPPLILTTLLFQVGTSATVFAYGQTGSGKTHTISSFYVAVRAVFSFALLL